MGELYRWGWSRSSCLAVDMARSHDVPVPATRLLHQLYNACASLGEGSSDFAAIVKLYDSWTRAEVKGA